MSDPLITEARALLELREKATEGPWHVGMRNGGANGNNIYSHNGNDKHDDPCICQVGEIWMHKDADEVKECRGYPNAAFIAASHRMADTIASLLKELEACRADADKLGEALHQLRQWARAYPLSVFPEPDFARAHEVLKANGMTIDAISASNMRHVITQVIGIVDAAISTKGQSHE